LTEHQKRNRIVKVKLNDICGPIRVFYAISASKMHLRSGEDYSAPSDLPAGVEAFVAPSLRTMHSHALGLWPRILPPRQIPGYAYTRNPLELNSNFDKNCYRPSSKFLPPWEMSLNPWQLILE